MGIRLHEIELFAKNAKSSRSFYKDVLGLEMNHHEANLNVFDSGWPGVDFDTSQHYPAKARIGFVVDNLKQFTDGLEGKGIEYKGPMQSHLGMNIIQMEDPDGNIVEVQEFTGETPGVIRDAFRE